MGFLSKELFGAVERDILALCLDNKLFPHPFQAESLINCNALNWLLVGAKGSELLYDVSDPELHHHTHCLNFCYFVQNGLELLYVGWVVLDASLKLSKLTLYCL